MNTRITGSFIGIMVLATFAAGALLYPHLPLLATSHWDAAGNANGTLPRFWAAFLLPLIMLALWGVWALLPKIDPLAPGFKGFRYAYDFFWVLVTAFLAYVYALSLWANFEPAANISLLIIPAIALLFVTIGALLPLIKRNWFIGIRTPWTIASDLVWEKTHRVGSWLFMLAGVIAFASAYTSPGTAIWLTIAPIILASIATVIYSYVIYASTKRA